MKFNVSRDVLFLEFEKDALAIDKQLAQFDRFHSKKIYHERDNELSNLEGGILVLSQFLEFPSIETSSYNAQVDETEGEIVDNIVNGMDKLSLIDNAEPALKEETKKTPHQQVRRSIHTKIFPKRYDDFVTLDCELNLYAFDEPASFQEVVTGDVWRSAIQREYDALKKMEL